MATRSYKLPVSFLRTVSEAEVVESSRRTVSIEITAQGGVRVRMPYGMGKQTALSFLRQRADWVDAHVTQMRQRNPQNPVTGQGTDALLTEEDLKALKKAARADLTERLKRWAPQVGVTYGTVSIRAQKSRWGSCSTAGNISLNCLLALTPEFVRDYVVVHELCHRKEMNHSSRFWAEVGRVLPRYREARKWLKENGNGLVGRLG